MSTQNNQVNKLVKAMAKVAVQPKPKKNKKKNKRRKAKSTPGTTGQTTINQQGMITFSRLEYVGDVSSVGSFDLTPSSFPFLKSLASSFELYKWLKLEVQYKPAVGTQTAGAVTFGVDWSNKKTKQKRQEIASLTPMVDTPVWQMAKMTLPPSRIQTRREYILEASDVNDKQPGALLWASTASGSVGDMWINYTVQMYGTK